MVTTKSSKHKKLMEAGGVSKLHLAVFQGKQEKARKLLQKGCPDVNRGDKFGQTPLHIACHREGLLGCLQLLAAHEANLKALDANGNTALHSAAGSGAAAAAKFLLGRGLSVADKNKDGHTPMDICILHCPADKKRTMQLQLEGGAKVGEEDRAAGGGGGGGGYGSNRIGYRSSSSGGGGGGGGVEEAKQNTSLLFTPRRGPAKMAALSKDGGVAAVAAAAARTGASTPARRAAGAEEQPGVAAATPKKKRASLQELHLAIFQGDTAKVEEVVARGDARALSEADRHGQTPLHLACYKGSRVMTRLLVEGGANLEAVDVNGNGVVHAAVCDSPAVLAILIDHGADVTVANFDGLTPQRLCEQYCPPRLKERMLQLLKEAALAQAKATARKNQVAEEQVNIEAVYHQLAMLRSKLAATAAANTDIPASEAAEGAQMENALLTLVEANVRVVEGQRHALENMEKTVDRMERMFRRLHMRLDLVHPGDVSFS